MNDPKTAAQHNAHQTGATYSTEDNWDLQKELKKLHVPTIDFVAINRFLAEREALVKERDTLREQVTKLREALRSIDSLTPLEINTSNYNHDDVCALNANAAEAGLTAHKALAETGAK